MEAAELVAELHDLAGGWGLPAAVQYTVDRLPGSLTADVGYDVAMRLGLLAGGLAEVVAARAHTGDLPARGRPVERRRRTRLETHDDGVAASAMTAAVFRPIIHPWMVVAPAHVWHAVARIDDLGPRLLTAVETVGLPAVESGLEGALDQVRDAFAALARACEDDGAAVRRLTHRPRAAGQVRTHTDRLAAADARCRDTLRAAAHALPDLATLLSGSAWDVDRGPLDLAHLDALPVDVLTLRLAADETLLARVTDPARADAPPWLVAALQAQGRGHEASLLQVERVRAACGGQTSDTLTRASLTHPRLVGGLDGVPVDHRLRANRLLMRADLERLRVADVDAEAGIARRRLEDRRSRWLTVRGAVLDAWLSSPRITALATVAHDRPAPARGDRRAVIALTQQLLHDRDDQGRGMRTHRQVLAYDPVGRVVELWGRLDERTRRVIVYVGGTGTTPRQFGWPTGIARSLQRADDPDTTVAVAWMGAEFPNAIGTQSPWGRLARLAAAPLRDCVAGLGVPDGVPVTAVGHSYGGVVIGAAEALGLRVDRVVHAGSPGIGPGVRSVESYPAHDATGRARHVSRWSLTAPGDLIRWWRRGDAAVENLGAAARWRPVKTAAARFADATLGADPTRAPGIVELDTGIWERGKHDREPGEILFGPRGHADVVEPGTTAFRRIVEVIHGRDPRLVVPRADIPTFRWVPWRGAHRPRRNT